MAVFGERLHSNGRQMKWLGIALLLLSISSGDAWSQTAGDSDEQKARP